ncbi:MAG TPA: integrase family protein [Polyangiaceae bacterium]
MRAADPETHPRASHSAVQLPSSAPRATVQRVPRLTAKLLATLQPSPDPKRPTIVRDDTVRGLFAQVGPTGAISFKVQADLRVDGKRVSVKQTLGRYPALSIDAARAEAMRLLAEVREGRDPRAGAPAPDTAHWTVGKAFERYVADLAKRPGSELSQRDMNNRLARYLDDWRELPLRELTKEMCEARQAQVAAQIKATARQRNATGARTANAVVRDLGAVWEFAVDYTPLPPVNPTRRVTMIGEVREHHEIPIAELGAWWTAVGGLKNPLRRAMHRLGLLAGVRPANLVGIERAWLRLDRGAIDYPARVMKGRVAFTLPLSAYMVGLVREALAAGDVLEPGSPWLFPTRSKTGELQATTVVREKAAALRDRTGHALRHTYKTCARNARIPESTIDLLMAHSLGAMRDRYGSLEDQLDTLREDQEKVTAYILARVTAQG